MSAQAHLFPGRRINLSCSEAKLQRRQQVIVRLTMHQALRMERLGVPMAGGKADC